MRDIVFLFGAGASFGASGIIPERPPLGAQLFAELARIYPGSWGNLPADFKLAFTTNFESGMALIYQRAGVAIPQLMRELAIYFVQFRPVSPDCLYRVLVRRLLERKLADRVIFSTLNYECTLEFGAVAEGAGISYFEQEPKTSFPVWKLHGSCNFFSQGLKAGPGILYGPGVVFEGGIQAFPDISSVVQHCLVETALAPVMSLYMEGKPLAVSPSAIKQIQGWWTEAVSKAHTVAVVGVYPNPSDSHLWVPLAKTAANLLFIGSETAFSSWRAENRKGPAQFLGSRFSNAQKTLMECLT